jgi:AAA15 family ATPase/GTPase
VIFSREGTEVLVFFCAENFRSINEPIELNLRANNYLKRHKNHVRRASKNHNFNILKNALIYGANASGKSNIFKAIDFAQSLIVSGPNLDTTTGVTPFSLAEKIKPNSKFYFEFFSGNILFKYGFELDSTKIIEEELIYDFGKGDNLIYRRTLDKSGQYSFIFDVFGPEGLSDLDDEYDEYDEFRKSLSGEDSNLLEEVKEIHVLARFTPKNKLFITEIIEKSNDHSLILIESFIRTPYNFFQYDLVVIFPYSKYLNLHRDVDKSSVLKDIHLENLKCFDSSIDKIKRVEVNSSRFSEKFLNSIKIKLKNHPFRALIETFEGTEYRFEINEDKDVLAYVLNAVHKVNKSSIEFDLSEESDGTLRLLDFLPILSWITKGNSSTTYLVDEIDRSLHPLLAKKFLAKFIDDAHKDDKSQLIVTTHEAELLDNDLVRRDEIYFVQRERDLSSKLYSLDDYSSRFDADIHKAYLSGRYGAIPLLIEQNCS